MWPAGSCRPAQSSQRGRRRGEKPGFAIEPQSEVIIVTELLIILALILLNGIFAGSEIAVISLRKTRLAQLVDDGRAGARAVASLRRDPERFLATVQIGITVVSATAAAFGGQSIAVRLVPLLEPLIGESAEQVALGSVVVGVSFLSLVLGELVPKSLALRMAERYALLVGRPFLALASVARPVVWVLTSASNLVLRLFGDRTSFSETRLSRDELVQLVDEAASAGTVDAEAGGIATRALDLEEIDAEDIMVPRKDVVALPSTVSPAQLFTIAAEGGHVRMPVHDGDLDHLVGVVHLRDALSEAHRCLEAGGGEVDLAAVARPVPFVAEWTSGTELLRTMQRRRAQICMVVDEHGTTRGLVSMEDLMEELVGEIADSDEDPAPLFEEEPDGAVRVDASVPVHELVRATDLSLPEHESYATVGGMALYLAGRIPAEGERFPAGEGLELEVVEATPRRVRVVRLHRLAPPPAAEAEPGTE